MKFTLLTVLSVAAVAVAMPAEGAAADSLEKRACGRSFIVRSGDSCWALQNSGACRNALGCNGNAKCLRIQPNDSIKCD